MTRTTKRHSAAKTLSHTAIAMAACLVALPAAARADSCTALSSSHLLMDGVASTVSLTATSIAATATVPAYCDVKAVVSSNANPAQSQIQMEVALPEPTAWNGRLLGTGNGGFAGAIIQGEILYGMAHGFASVNSDLGTGLLFGCGTLYCGDKTGNGGAPGGLYHNAAAITDFGYGSMHLMTLAAKELVATYYGRTQNKSYFMGCSTGGHNALMEGEKYPNDYDGIVAGAPAYDRTHLHIASAASYLATHFAADAKLTSAGLTLTHAAMLAQCAGHDGGAATDGYLMQPEICAFKPSSLQCTGAAGEVPCNDPNAASCTCLNADQSQVLDTLYTGSKDNHSRILYPGYEPGVEDPATTGSVGILFQQAGTEPLFDGLDYWAFGPKFTWQSLFANTTSLNGELAARIAKMDNVPVGITTFKGALNATSINWTDFYRRGGKLIMFHGLSDPLIPTASTWDYYNAVATAAPNEYAKFMRLFLAPGVFHCGGGPGPDTFGFFGAGPAPMAASDDILGALIAWREQGIAPETIVATKYSSGTVTAQRPLCAYPSHAVLTAGSDPKLAASFTCQAGARITSKPYPRPYGP